MSWLEEPLHQGSGTVPGSGGGAEDSAPCSVPSLPPQWVSMGFSNTLHQTINVYPLVTHPQQLGEWKQFLRLTGKKINLAEWKVIALK